ncbi:GNAT family N-acetyltransferase [Flavobacterium sp. SM2513]|uniref:GNAT family N-acetyltransferase n=1 Tax=Flavobacterium sp. SM2513 TaxID=3424766 RepID=UPI003D7F7C89
MEDIETGVEFSTDKSKIDIELTHKFLTNSYWAKGRTIEAVKKSIENSFCFGIYLNGAQIGFARVLSDNVLAYVTDLFIIEEYRGKGFSKVLLEKMLSQPELAELDLWFLATKDSQLLYEKFGFTMITNPEMYMTRSKNSIETKWYKSSATIG